MQIVNVTQLRTKFLPSETATTRSPISHASARQRSGRAGRVKPGKCYRLYTLK